MSTTKATTKDNKKEPYVDPALPEAVPEHLKHFEKVFHKSMKNIEALYVKYQKESSDQTPLPEDHYSLFVEWALHWTEYCENGMQSGENFEEKELNSTNCHKASSREHFFRSCFPDFLSKTWPIRFNRKFLKKFGNINNEHIQQSILYKISEYTKGHFFSTAIELQGLSYMTFFKEKLTQTLVYCVHVERVPEFSSPNKVNLWPLRIERSNYNQVKAWKYVHVVRLLDLLHETEKVTALNTCLNFLEDCKKDPARQECQPKLKDKKEKYMRYGGNEPQYMFEIVKCFHGEAIFPTNIFKLMEENQEKYARGFNSMEFEIDYLTPEEVEDLVYYQDIKRWVSKKAYSLFLRKQEESVVSKMNAEIISKFADFESSGRLVELLEKMKNLKIKLTGEEKKLIGQDGNVLAIGRSGTGKTTCSVLRLFSQDMLYKLRLAQSKVQQGMLRDTRNMSDQLDNMIGIHSVFVTASPVLTNEVSRYYQNLSKRIKKELKKKEKPAGSEQAAPQKDKTESEIVSEKAPENEETAPEEEETETFNEEDYLMDDEEAEMMAKLNKNYSLENIEDKEFPLFLTVKRLVLMIDGCLQQPFFARKKDNTIIGSDTHAQWHNELKGLMMISDKFRGEGANEDDDEPTLEPKKAAEEENLIKEEDEEEEEEEGGYESMKIDQADIEKEYERYQAILKKKKEQMEEEGRLRKKNKMSFEVDYDYFANHFWNGYLSRQDRPADLSPIIIWSEITSTIKGSADSHLCPGFYLSREVYTALQKEGSTFLNQKNRTKVYDLFVTYEEWKEKEGAYDFMDIVNHALNEVRLRGYNGSPIHFTMIDEVQDLSHATILLLTKITEQSVFFAGDTAQTIAKGVGVRFSDLSSVFKHAPEKEQMWKRPVVHQLTVNFRSHGKILDIANSVVSLMETYFPKTIDKLKKEKSEVDGPKPIILEDVNMEVLFAVLFGTENFKSHRHSQNQASGALEKPPIEFGCNQAIIVRDQESKNKLPPLLKHALCLTVYEAKGLEFDDVILYNFFSESPLTAKEWELLSLLDIEEKKVDKDTFERYYFTYKEEKNLNDLKTEEQQDQMDFGRKEEKAGELDLEAPNLFNMQLDQATNQYSLKKVALAKRVYEIYDYFENYGMVCNEFKQLYVALTRPRNRIVIYDDNVVKRQPMEAYWKNLNLVQIINKGTLESANAAAESSSANKDLESFKSLIASTSEEEWKKQGLKMFRNKYYEQAVKCFERSKDEQLRKRAEAYMLAEKASDTIRNIKSEQNLILKDLSQIKEKDMKEKRVRAKQLRSEEKGCFGDYEKAANIFVELGLLKQAAQCYFSAEVFEKALEIYEKLELFREAGEACFMLRQYERTAVLFLKGGDFVRAIECYEQSRNYNKILEILENLKDLPSDQRKYYAQRYVPLALKGLAEELENKASTPAVVPKEKEDVIKEGESDSEEEEEEAGKKKQNVSEMSFEVIDKSKKSVSDISFENVEEDLDNYEHLSQYDVVNDEFLKSESGSIIESLASLRKEKSLTSSEFSAIDYNYLMDNHYQLVKTKADIFVQDAMMEKIIKYIDMFAQDFKESLQNLRSKDVLLTEAVNKTNLPGISTNLIDLDHISLDFVYFALDFLEQHKLFKLCIFVCNRYSLANKLGRYLVNMAFKYSNFPYDDIRASFIKIIQHRSRQIQQEKAFVANLALHNVLEIVNPKYLKLKKKGEVVDETNSLGDDCFSQLISLGFWKKCLFLMDYNNSLGLASTFASFNNYKLIYLTGSDAYTLTKEDIKKSVESEGFGFLPFEIPSNNDEAQAAIITLESVIWDLSEKFPAHLYKHYKPVVSSGGIKVPQFPLYFVCNEALWNFIVNKNREKLAEVLESATIELEAILLNKEINPIMQARLFDIVTFMVQIIEFYNSNNLLSEFINKLDVRIATKYITALTKIVEQILDGPCLNKSEELIIKAILSPFRIRYIERTSVLKKIGLHNYLAHISSPIMSDIIVSDGSNTGGLLYDIEANFVLVPTDLCLKGIRRRIADIMRHIISYQVKAYPSYDEGTRMVYVLEDVKEYLNDKVKLLRAISCYEYCHTYVQGIKNSPVKKSKVDTFGDIKKAEAKKKKQREEDDGDAYEHMEEDEKFDNMIGDYGHHKVDLKARLDKVAKPKDKPVAKSGQQQPKEKGEGEFVGVLKAEILREIKFLFSNFVNISLDLDYFARTELLGFALQKLNKYLYQNKTKVWVIHLLVAIGHRVTLNEVLRKNKQNAIAQNLQLYSDAIYYKQFFCSEDYTNNIFDFLSAAEDLTNKELLSVVEDLVGYVIAADSVKQKDSQICLSASLLHGLGVPAINKAEKLQINISPLNLKDLLADILNWIATAAEKLNRNKIGPQFCRIVVLIQNLIANVSDLDDNSFNALNEAVGYILENKVCNFKIKEVETKKNVTRKREDLTKSETSFLEALEVNLESLETLSEGELEQFVNSYLKEDLVVISIESDAKIAKKNYDRSEAAFLKDESKIAQRITLQRKLRKLFAKKGLKLREKLLFNARKTGYHLELVENNAKRDILRLIASADVNLGILFGTVDEEVRRVLNFYANQAIYNPIDFHHLWNLSQKLIGFGLEFVESMKECLKNKKKVSELKELYKEKLNKIEETMKQFDEWRASQAAKAEDKGSKKQKFTRVKWEEEALVAKMQQIAKKRKGLKKQFLQQRKFKIDGFVFKKK